MVNCKRTYVSQTGFYNGSFFLRLPCAAVAECRSWLAAEPSHLHGAEAIQPEFKRQYLLYQMETKPWYTSTRATLKTEEYANIFLFFTCYILQGFFPPIFSSRFLFFLFPFVLPHTPCCTSLASPPSAGSPCLPISHLPPPPFPSPRLAEEGWECQEGPNPALVTQPMSLQAYDKPVVFLPAVIVGETCLRDSPATEMEAVLQFPSLLHSSVTVRAKQGWPGDPMPPASCSVCLLSLKPLLVTGLGEELLETKTNP